MGISRRTDYALRLIAMLAQTDGSPMSVRVAAEYQDVPYSFARGIQHALVLSGLVKARRGAHGGIMLAHPADEITVWDVIESIQGTLTISVCSVDPEWCKRSKSCPFHHIWLDVDEVVHDKLSTVTIADMVTEQGILLSKTQLERLASIKKASDEDAVPASEQERHHETWSKRAIRAAERREARESKPKVPGKAAKTRTASEASENATVQDGS
jgi:Rrf2 family protein